jgi:hypothetical protein
MKCLFTALIVVIGALAVTSQAYANTENVPSGTNSSDTYGTDEALGANVLITEPVTINNNWANVIDPTDNLKQTANSISLVRERGCEQINPLELVQNPAAILKECEKQKNNPISERTDDLNLIEYFKVPELESGISVTVTKF